MDFVYVNIEAARRELFAAMWTHFLRGAVGFILVCLAFVGFERSLIFKSPSMTTNHLRLRILIFLDSIKDQKERF